MSPPRIRRARRAVVAAAALSLVLPAGCEVERAPETDGTCPLPITTDTSRIPDTMSRPASWNVVLVVTFTDAAARDANNDAVVRVTMDDADFRAAAVRYSASFMPAADLDDVLVVDLDHASVDEACDFYALFADTFDGVTGAEIITGG